MLISHESPLQLLHDSRQYNDYQYALVHLFEHPRFGDKYFNHFKSCVEEGGEEVLLDNSIFELGTAFDSKKYSTWIEELKPSHYIVPDVLENAELTMESWEKFIDQYSLLPGNRIGVVQGKTYEELVKCYEFMDRKADYIAISFDYSYYNLTGYGRTKLERLCSGRQKLIDSLMSDGVWNRSKPHHLLGCSLPREFKHYYDYESIRSVDTSNPVMAGIKGMNYVSDIGLNTKPPGLLAEHMEAELNDQQMDSIMKNIEMFKVFAQ